MSSSQAGVHSKHAGVVVCADCGIRNRIPEAASGVPRCASCHHELPWLVEATDSTFDAVIESRPPVLVDLWAPWCGPCRMVAPAVQEASKEFAGRLKVVKVNVDQSPKIAARLAVQGIPTLLILRDGEVVARQVGALPENRLLSWIRDSLDPAAA